MASNPRENVFTDPFEDLMRGFLFPRLSYEGQNAARFPMDVSENEIAVRVRADLPGVRKEDIAVSVEGNTVTITAEVRADVDGRSADRVLRAERYVGRLERSFSLAPEIEEDGAEARYVDGVLELVLPKKVATAHKRIVVS